jgi:hypothetical protein
MTKTETTATHQAATVAEQRAPGTPEKPFSKKVASLERGAPRSQKLAKGKAKGKTKVVAPETKTKANQKAPKPAGGTEISPLRAESKGAKIVQMIRRPQGATRAELMRVTGWQAHSVRGFLSGSLGKKLGLTVESFKNPQGERTYRLPA